MGELLETRNESPDHERIHPAHRQVSQAEAIRASRSGEGQMMRQIVHLGLTLVIVCLVAALGLGLTYAVTKDRIAEQKRIEEVEACVDALPGVKKAEELKEDKALEKEARKHVPDIEKVFRCSEGDIIIIKVKGYGGPIRMAVGIGNDGKVAGISIISHNETPGLGANVEKKEFLGQFKGKGSEDKLEIGEDIDAITGATITSKAAVKEVKEALEAWREIHGQ